MPYIKPEKRAELSFLTIQMKKIMPAVSTPGDLNYLITELCLAYTAANKKGDSYSPNYALINEVIGAMECAKLEFYRRLAAPYEDVKIAENGDVYPTRNEL